MIYSIEEGDPIHLFPLKYLSQQSTVNKNL